MDRLNSAIHRLKLAAGDLREVADTLAEEHHSAAFVVVEAAQELAQLYEDLGTWSIHHEYTARPVGQAKTNRDRD
jgi:hypothetical protein